MIEYEIQTKDQVKNIRHRQTLKQQLKEGIENSDNVTSDNIDEKLNILIDLIPTSDDEKIDSLETKINELNTDLLNMQNQTMLEKIQKTEQDIKNINDKIDLILKKL